MSESPKNTAQKVDALFKEIEEESSKGNYIYRGEAGTHINDSVTSTLYRDYYKKYEKEIKEGILDISTVHEHILEDAGLYTTFTDYVDIIAELRHYGGRINLIDFTADYRIALFFACHSKEEEKDKDGRIILFNTDKRETRIIEPKRNQNQRVISQRSVFVVPKDGYIPSEEIQAHTINAHLKENILKYLEKHHRITTETIYNDIYGYIQRQKGHQEAYMEFYRGVACQKKQELKEALAHYSNAIQLKPNYIDAYVRRARIYNIRHKADEAEEDNNQARKLKLDITEKQHPTLRNLLSRVDTLEKK